MPRRKTGGSIIIADAVQPDGVGILDESPEKAASFGKLTNPRNSALVHAHMDELLEQAIGTDHP